MTVSDILLEQLVDIIEHPNLNLYAQPPYNLDGDSQDAYCDRVIADFKAKEENK